MEKNPRDLDEILVVFLSASWFHPDCGAVCSKICQACPWHLVWFGASPSMLAHPFELNKLTSLKYLRLLVFCSEFSAHALPCLGQGPWLHCFGFQLFSLFLGLLGVSDICLFLLGFHRCRRCLSSQQVSLQNKHCPEGLLSLRFGIFTFARLGELLDKAPLRASP